MRRVLRAWMTVGVCLLSSPVSGDSERPQGVSPGSPTRSQQLGTSCPTFSWSGISEAAGYELVVYRVTTSGVLETEFQVEVPGDARGWTPPASQCPSPDSHYAWAVRALSRAGIGPWSEALLFETAGMPSEDEVRQALRVLRRYQEGQRNTMVDPNTGGRPVVSGRDLVSPRDRHTLEGSRRPSHLREPLSADTVGALRSPQTVTPPAQASITIDGAFDLGGYVFKGGVPFIHNDGGLTFRNTAVGLNALVSATPSTPTIGAHNSALGYSALRDNTTGSFNTVSGSLALISNTAGGRNTASGFQTLFYNTTGSGNTASGSWALLNNTTGSNNTAIGSDALFFNTTGSNNTAIGPEAGYKWSTGSFNIALGWGAFGLENDSYTIRIGGYNAQDQTFIEGIRGASGTSTFDEAICTNFENQLGPCAPSSLRFKESVETMGDTATKVSALRPVTFRYKREEGSETERPLQYGLIAEEVAKVFPSLVSYDEEGEPYTVRYSLLTPLLLNEFQRQEIEVVTLRKQVTDLRRRLEALVGKKRLRAE